MAPRLDEEALRALVEAGDVRAAVDQVLQAHGGAFFAYIVGLVGDETLAADAFQLFSMRLWKSLGDFRWESRLSTWAYTVARNAAYRTLEDPHRKRGERLGTADEEALVAQWTRTGTARWQETGAQRQLWALVDDLPRDDRELLLLRLGQRLSWTEVASVMHPDMTDADELKRVAATARKRFERIKLKLQQELGDP